MPEKVNPVIPEFVISVAHKIYANDLLISLLSAQGCLELNVYIPIIGHAVLESIKLLIAANNSLRMNLFEDLKVNTEITLEKLLKSPAITTALSPYIGYTKAAEIAKIMKRNNFTITEANEKLKLIESEKLKIILKPEIF